MYYDKLERGWGIEFRYVQDEQLKFMKTPIYKTKRELNERLKELYNDPACTRAEVYTAKYFDKTL